MMKRTGNGNGVTEAIMVPHMVLEAFQPGPLWLGLSLYLSSLKGRLPVFCEAQHGFRDAVQSAWCIPDLTLQFPHPALPEPPVVLTVNPAVEPRIPSSCQRSHSLPEKASTDRGLCWCHFFPRSSLEFLVHDVWHTTNRLPSYHFTFYIILAIFFLFVWDT